MKERKKEKETLTLKLSKFIGCISDTFQLIFNSLLLWIAFNAASGSKTVKSINWNFKDRHKVNVKSQRACDLHFQFLINTHNFISNRNTVCEKIVNLLHEKFH